MTDTPQTWFSTKEAATYCRITPRQLRRWKTDGRVRAYGSRYSRSDLDAAIRGDRVVPDPPEPELINGLAPTEVENIVRTAQQISQTSEISFQEALDALREVGNWVPGNDL